MGEGDLLADVDLGTVDDCDCGSVHETVDKRRVRIQINLLDAAGELVGGLSPVMIFHRDYENGLDLLRFGTGASECSEAG